MKAHELLSSPDKWCQLTEAETATGEVVMGDDPEAVKFCVLGAIHRCYPGPFSQRQPLHWKIQAELNGVQVDEWNDDEGTTWEQVHDLLVKLDI